MKVNEMIHLLDAKLISGSPELEVHTACGSDMMSDVLAFVKDQAVLLTGLVNPQVVRTADMMDIHCVVFVRGKEPDKAMLSLADPRESVLTRQKGMFPACGLLYQAGLRGGDDE